METHAIALADMLVPSLKPSLVEWKPVALQDVPSQLPHLETFLGGMETGIHQNVVAGCDHSLKPSLVEWKHWESGWVLWGDEP